MSLLRKDARTSMAGNETRAVIASLLAELRGANLSVPSQTLEYIRVVRGISSTETSIHWKPTACHE